MASKDRPAMRLNQYLARCGVASRRGGDDLIREGRVSVNRKVVTELATRVKPGRDRVLLDGRRIDFDAKHTYYILNKPPGYDVTHDDPHSENNVYQLLPQSAPKNLKAVGRLDRRTTGLLLLTDDGDLNLRLTHPRYGVEKEYLAWGNRSARPEQVRRLLDGVELDDGPARAIKVEKIRSPRDRRPGLRIILHMGKKRIVRRMCAAVDYSLVALHRERIGPLMLGDLKEGKCRRLNSIDVRRLRRATADKKTDKKGAGTRRS